MNFRSKLEQKQFMITLEVDPPKGPGIKKIMSQLEPLIPLVDAINIAACPVAQLRMDALAFACLLNRHFDIEVILHITMRDMSLLGLQSQLLGASALGYQNFLVMTGDAAKHSDIEGTKGVFQANSLALLKLMKQMNLGFNSSNKKMNKKTRFYSGATANPSAINLPNEVKKMQRKIDAGAEFFQTQPLFIRRNVEIFAQHSEHLDKPVILGTMLLKNYDSTLRLNSKVPGLFVPAPVLERMKKNNNQEEALKIAYEFWSSCKDLLGGIHLFPMHNYEAMTELLTDIKNNTLNYN
ncbi:MAG: methylenetetrahydrofolate reductase [bacterium]|nr:methylenetetrahydrofolate reductase [bacterium]